MSIESEVAVGTVAIVKVGRNEVEVIVTEITEHGWMVKSQSTGRKFEVKRIERIIGEPNADVPETVGKSEELDEDDYAVNPAPESGKPDKMSLFNAAVEVLKISGNEMNTREMVKGAIDLGLWAPTGCKTPEQTLYGSIFREIRNNEHPRIVKAEKKGKFRLA